MKEYKAWRIETPGESMWVIGPSEIQVGIWLMKYLLEDIGLDACDVKEDMKQTKIREATPLDYKQKVGSDDGSESTVLKVFEEMLVAIQCNPRADRVAMMASSEW